jgi:hypothetical protein
LHVLAHWNNSLQVDMSLHIILSAPTRVCSSSLKLHDWWKSSKYQFYSLWTYLTMASPRFLCRLTAFMDLLLPWDVRELYIRKTADLLLQLLVGTFPRFVAIRFYFLSEPTIYWIYLTMAWTHDLLDLPDHGLNPRATGFTWPWLEPTIYWIYPTMAWTHDLLDLPNHGLNPRSTTLEASTPTNTQLLWRHDFLPKYSFKLYYFYYFEMFYE